MNIMQNLLRGNYSSLIVILSLLTTIEGYAQAWQKDTGSFWPITNQLISINFLQNGPFGKDWIYGGYWDQDSVRRCVAYREGGQWKALPFTGYKSIEVRCMAMYGDTLYLGGSFGNLIVDSDSSINIPNTSLLKWHNDSLWADTNVSGTDFMSSRGDTLLIWGGVYLTSKDTIEYQFMTTDGGQTWQYPYSVVHPTESTPDFGATPYLRILDNGDILTLNAGSPLGSPYRGIARWDGQQWHAYGSGITGGGFSQVQDFELFKGDLYMGGTFAKYITFNGDTLSHFPQNPGNSIVRWDGSQWHEMSGGVLEGGIDDIFIHNGIVFGQAFAGNPDYHQFGDVKIPHLAGWDTQKWCGTPTDFDTWPLSFGFVNDTLFVAFNRPGVINGDTVGFMAYFDGDYVNGPDAICSTPGLGEEEAVLSVAGLEIYPNPAGNEVHLSLESTPIRQVRLYDLSGRLILERQWSRPVYKTVLDISGLRPGVYLVEVNGNTQHRLVKQ